MRNRELLNVPFYGGTDPTYKGKSMSGSLTGPSDDSESHPFVAYRGGDDDAQYKWFGTGEPIPMRLGCLYARGLIGDPKALYCPSARDASYQYKSYTYPTKWGTLPQEFNKVLQAQSPTKTLNEWIRVGYEYYPIDETLGGSTGMEPESFAKTMVPKYTSRRYSQLSRSAPFAADRMWSRNAISHKSGIEKTTYHLKNGGINAVFKDGHVRFVTDDNEAGQFVDAAGQLVFLRFLRRLQKPARLRMKVDGVMLARGAFVKQPRALGAQHGSAHEFHLFGVLHGRVERGKVAYLAAGPIRCESRVFAQAGED